MMTGMKACFVLSVAVALHSCRSQDRQDLPAGWDTRFSDPRPLISLLQNPRKCATALDLESVESDVSVQFASELQRRGLPISPCKTADLGGDFPFVQIDFESGLSGCTHCPPPYFGPRYARGRVVLVPSRMSGEGVEWELIGAGSAAAARAKFVKELVRMFKLSQNAGSV